MRCRRIAVAALLAAAALPAAARADEIVFRRDGDVWRMAPDGTRQQPVTHGERRYEWPSAADDGTILAPDTGGTLHRLTPAGQELNAIPTAATTATEDAPAEPPTHVRISPGGTKIAYDEAIGGDVTTLWTPADATAPASGGQAGFVAPSWIGDDELLLSRDVSADPGVTFVRYPIGGDPVPWFSDDQTWATGFDAAASRDGARIAVLADDAAENEGTPRRLALRLFAGTAFRCEIALPPEETYGSASPTLSPDGTRVAWAQGDGIHVARADDCGGRRVLTLPGAWEPYWSAAAAPAAPKLTLAIATRARPHRHTVRKRGIAVRVTVSAPATVRLTVRAAGRVVGRATRRLDAGTTKVRIRVRARARRLVVRATASGATAVTKTIRPRG